MIVAIVGRPNVGKSTLFNKLTKSRSSIVSPIAGVTRDRLYGQITLANDEDEVEKSFTVIDTGGFETDDLSFQPFDKNLVWQQTKIAIIECDLVLFLFDGKDGLHPHDHKLLDFLRKEQKPTIHVVNKVDGQNQNSMLWEFLSLGLEENPFAISAAHSRGLKSLLDKVCLKLEELIGQNLKAKEDSEDNTTLALIGRPNAGKSSILNRLVGEERSLVSPVAGTTRDSLESDFNYNNKSYTIVDTAGIRRKTKIKELIENQSVFQSINALQKARVIIYVIDALEGLKDQDARLLNMAYDRRRAIIIVVNKWDLVPAKENNTMRTYEKNLRTQLGDLGFIPIHFMSCEKNLRVHKMLSLIEDITAESNKRVDRKDLEETLERAVAANPPVMDGVHKKPARFQYIKQTSVMPPTVMIRCNQAMLMKTAYKRYLRNRLKRELGWNNIPIRMIMQGKEKGDRVRL